VLNQLLTLVKRGMAPCNLPALAGDSKSSSDTDSQKPADVPTQEKHRRSFLPHSFRFSSKSAQSGTQSSTVEAQTPPLDSRPPSAKNVTAEADNVVVESPQANRSDSDQTHPLNKPAIPYARRHSEGSITSRLNHCCYRFGI
jgi:hypothetical protein